MQSQLSRYWPLTTTTCLVLLAGCGVESARRGPATDGTGAVTSAVLASDAGANSGAGVATPAPASNPSSGRPMLERRVTASVQVAGDRPAQRATSAEPDAGSAEARSDVVSVADTDSGGQAVVDGDDADPEVCSAADSGDDDAVSP